MISTKKLATIGTSAALFAASAMPALAWGGHGSSITVEQKNYGGNDNAIVVSSNTGGNTGSGFISKVKTGNASTDNATVLSTVNGNLADVDGCGCSVKKITVEQKNKGGNNNTILVASNTGDNTGSGFISKVKTGDASTNNATVVSLVNTNVAMVN